MKMKFAAVFLLVALLLSGCREVGEKPTSSSPSSEVSSAAVSSERNDMFPESSQVSTPQASEEDRPAAVAISAGVSLQGIDQFDSAAVTWGPGHAVDDQNKPTACIQLQEKYGDNGAVFLLEDGEAAKNIYLTFDEGYENGYTEKILDVLKEKECPAVFFVTMDYVQKQPELIQRMIDEGHVVGNHSVNHKSMPTLDDATAVEEIAGLHNYMVENYNYQMTEFRPPEGAFSERSLEIAKAVGYRSVLWSFAYRDYFVDDQPDPAAAFTRITDAAHNGAVYLLHAVSKTNTEILGDVIDHLREQGYTFAKM